MAITLETAEIQLDTVGAEAVQQTLAALGVQAKQVNSEAADATIAAPDQAAASATPQTNENPGAFDDTRIIAALDRQTEILERIATALQREPTQPPTY